MINPQRKPTSPEKKSLKSIKKFLPKLSSIARKEGLVDEKDKKVKEPLKVETILSVLKDEKVQIKV